MSVFVVFLVRIFPHLNWKPSVCYDTCLLLLKNLSWIFWLENIFTRHFYYIEDFFGLHPKYILIGKSRLKWPFLQVFTFYCKVFNQLKNMPFIVKFSVSCKVIIVTLILKAIFLSCSCENFHRDLQSKSPYSFQMRENKDQKNGEWGLQASVSIHN